MKDLIHKLQIAGIIVITVEAISDLDNLEVHIENLKVGSFFFDVSHRFAEEYT